MQIPDPAPFARGLAVAAACLVGIPAACRSIEDFVTQSGSALPYPAIALAALLVFAMARKTQRQE